MRRAALLALLLGACVPSEGPTMAPGEDCLGCHNSGEGPDFTAAGTVFTNTGDPTGAGVRGVKVSLRGANGREIRLTTNQAGNFYTREKLAFPLVARLEGGGVTRVMTHPVPHGACNLCHDVPPRADQGLEAPIGRIALIGGGTGDEFMNPGDDCLACHDGRAAPAWSVAGTVFENGAGAEGVTIRLRTQTGQIVKELLSNRVGNFFTADALPAGRFKIEIQRGATVRTMNEDDPPAPVSCNRCHGRGEQSPVSLSGGGE